MVTQKARHPWIVFGSVLAFFASIGFITIGYFNWPPQMNFSWIVGTVVTIGTILCAITNGIRLFYSEPYRFAINDDEIIIKDWGILRPRVRKFTTSSITEICHSSEGASFLKTKDGETHYIDDVLMYNYSIIFELIQMKYNHIATRDI